MRRCDGKVRPNTLARYRTYAKHLEPLAHYPLSELKVAQLEVLYKDLSTKLGRSHLVRISTFLQRFKTFWVFLIGQNPSRVVKQEEPPVFGPGVFLVLLLVGDGGLEPPTSRLSGVRSNQLS